MEADSFLSPGPLDITTAYEPGTMQQDSISENLIKAGH